jgi:hypothetical protein
MNENENKNKNKTRCISFPILYKRSLNEWIYAHQFSSVTWPSGLRRWFKAPISSEARVRIPPLPLIFFHEIN